ncbi:Lipid A biosynthesis lauroyl acyltransferase [Anaerovibrio sp. JC8]|uniref:lysophospholipid acyltransferase family protein n=1 Tax=Anaerovibrio sp. JC8 TaxID=1240085 RepID=UPI000A0C0A49|nr:lysophospholipid acyltransferase family protein [Anaerovibrio sp. JC8]ORU00950.1 Lipid A biosynthesis lauroyl acyltransferase [Anaerovibrio sp. JC8]
MGYYLMKMFSWLACRFSMAGCNRFGKILGKLTWGAVPKRRKVMAVDNIKRCLGVDDAEAKSIAKASWVQFGPMLMEVLRYPELLKNDRMKEYVTIDGLEYLQEAIDKKQGAVIATSHSDSWELMGAALAQYGVPLVGVARKQKDGAMDRFINEYRTMVGMHITYTKGIREMFKMIKEGWMIGLITDQDPAINDGIILNFFNRPTNCFTGPAQLARFQNAPIFHGQIVHRPDGGHHITIYPPIYVDKTNNKKADIEKATQQVMDLLEAHIREYPEDWFWLHDRWKSAREAGLE